MSLESRKNGSLALEKSAIILEKVAKSAIILENWLFRKEKLIRTNNRFRT
jgi:hypothetical protein